MTRFIYALKEIRACLEAEILTNVQQELAVLSQNMKGTMVNASFINGLPPQLT